MRRRLDSKVGNIINKIYEVDICLKGRRLGYFLNFYGFWNKFCMVIDVFKVIFEVNIKKRFYFVYYVLKKEECDIF